MFKSTSNNTLLCILSLHQTQRECFNNEIYFFHHRHRLFAACHLHQLHLGGVVEQRHQALHFARLRSEAGVVGIQSLALLRHACLQPSFKEGRLSRRTWFRQDHLKTRKRNTVFWTVKNVFAWSFVYIYFKTNKQTNNNSVMNSPRSRMSAPHGTAWGRRCRRARPEWRPTWLEKRSSHRNKRSMTSHSFLTGLCPTFLFKLTSFTANVLRKLIEPMQRKSIVRRGFVLIGWTQHSAASFDSLNKLACKGLELPGGCCSSQQQIQALSGQHVSQHPQKALRGLGMVRIYSLMKERSVSRLANMQSENCQVNLDFNYRHQSWTIDRELLCRVKHQTTVLYFEDVGDGRLSPQDETRVRLDICIFCRLQPRGKLPVLRPESRVRNNGDTKSEVKVLSAIM